MLNPLDHIAKTVSQKLGTSSEELKEAAKSGNIHEALKNLNSEQANQVKKIISDKEATSKLLSSPQAQQILKKIFGEKH